jgi:hypothetical protein
MIQPRLKNTAGELFALQKDEKLGGGGQELGFM